MNYEQLEKAFDSVWKSGGKPEELHIQMGTDQWTVITKVKEEDKICTPAGLANIFPALRKEHGTNTRTNR